MSSGSTLPPTGGLAELGISYSTLQSTCRGTLKSLTRYPDGPLLDPDDPDRDDGDPPADPAAAATIREDGTPAAAASGLGYEDPYPEITALL